MVFRHSTLTLDATGWANLTPCTHEAHKARRLDPASDQLLWGEWGPAPFVPEGLWTRRRTDPARTGGVWEGVIRGAVPLLSNGFNPAEDAPGYHRSGSAPGPRSQYPPFGSSPCFRCGKPATEIQHRCLGVLRGRARACCFRSACTWRLAPLARDVR